MQASEENKNTQNLHKPNPLKEMKETMKEMEQINT